MAKWGKRFWKGVYSVSPVFQEQVFNSDSVWLTQDKYIMYICTEEGTLIGETEILNISGRQSKCKRIVA